MTIPSGDNNFDILQDLVVVVLDDALAVVESRLVSTMMIPTMMIPIMTMMMSIKKSDEGPNGNDCSKAFGLPEILIQRTRDIQNADGDDLVAGCLESEMITMKQGRYLVNCCLSI